MHKIPYFVIIRRNKFNVNTIEDQHFVLVDASYGLTPTLHSSPEFGINYITTSASCVIVLRETWTACPQSASEEQSSPFWARVSRTLLPSTPTWQGDSGAHTEPGFKITMHT